MPPLVLPEKLDLSGTTQENLEKLYGVFRSDLIDRRVVFQELQVVLDNRMREGYEEGFWHLVTRQDQPVGRRDIDYKRAKRLPWIRPLIGGHPHGDILAWEADEPNNRGLVVRKHYFWYDQGQYLIVLWKKPANYFLATAFYVNEGENRIRYREKYQKAKKKGSGL